MQPLLAAYERISIELDLFGLNFYISQSELDDD
jgi:hypothetical protein